MADEEFDMDDLQRRMDGAVKNVRTEFAGLRTGRASAGLVEHLPVEAYGSTMPLSQVSTISVPEPRMISVQIWDKSQVAAVEKSIRESSLGLNPILEGQLMRIPIPELNEERRQEIAKVAHTYAEQARIAVRNVRRDGMDKLKHLERDAHMSEDEHHLWSEEVQDYTNKSIKAIDEALAAKEEEIMQI
ncbi:MAG: ribosome recycling factor [Fimbriimonadaceae bacterium]|nr:ribosome recycling factor [Alphaproteobacteria bacterium]